MHKKIIFVLALFALGTLSIIPSVLKAELVVPDQTPQTFENLQSLTLSLTTGGAPFATSSIALDSIVDVDYQLDYTDAFFESAEQLTIEDKNQVFQETLATQKAYLELWRGEPFTLGASVVQEWELDTASGRASMSFPESGPYFIVAYISNEARPIFCVNDTGSPCGETNSPHFSRAETQAYFQRTLDSQAPWSNAYPHAFAGERLNVANGSAVSSVLFLPGIKGSRLYRSADSCAVGHDCPVKLWEPYGNPVVRQLFLDENGKSINEDVYARAGDVLSEAVSQKFYKSFFDELSLIKSSGTFGEGWSWEVASYDWRLSLNDLVERGSRSGDRIYYEDATDVPYIERLLRDLAATSPTGKVTIIAHSNGGLVAKALMGRLGDTEAAALVDKVVFVGVPQSGAPQALGAALFGYGEALPFDGCANWFGARIACSLLVDRETARTFAEHSPMTYHLLPSNAYFRDTNAGSPVAHFSGVDRYQSEVARYGNVIDSFSELSDFALARDGGRTRPPASDTGRANILSESLLAYAQDIHTKIDAWTPPAGVNVYEIAGWGEDTVSGIDFYEEPKYLNLFGDTMPRYRPTFFTKGDGVVPAASALLMKTGSNVKQYWADVKAAGKSHADLLEMPELRTLIRNILTNADAPLPSNISTTEPVPTPEKKWVFFMHSPLGLGIVYNSNYSGPNPDGTVVLRDPSIEYGKFGDVQYIIVPAGRKYTLRMMGIADGTFSLDIQEQDGESVTRTTTIANVPVNPVTYATFDVSEDGKLGNLQVDQDRNGSTDVVIEPRLGQTLMYAPATYIEPIAAPDPDPSSPATSTPPSTSTPPPATSPTSNPPAARKVVYREVVVDNDDKSEPIEVASSSEPEGVTPIATAMEPEPGTKITSTNVSIETTQRNVPQGIAPTTTNSVTPETPVVETSAPRTQTASAYDAFGTGLERLGKRVLLICVVILVFALVFWRVIRAKYKR